MGKRKAPVAPASPVASVAPDSSAQEPVDADADAQKKLKVESEAAVKASSSSSSTSTSSSSSISGSGSSATDKVEGDGAGQAGSDDGPQKLSPEAKPNRAARRTMAKAAKAKAKAKGRAGRANARDCDEGSGGHSGDDDPGHGDDEGNNQLHQKIRKIAQREGWPDGPSNVPELFEWPEYNASQVLFDKEAVQRVLTLLSHDIEIHEAYGGTGNGATTLHKQCRALQNASRQLAKE